MIFTQLDQDAQLPESTCLGYDLFSNSEYVIQPGCRAVVSTGVSVNFPEGTYGRLATRTGLAVKHGLTILADVVEPGYHEELKVVIHNTDTRRAFVIHKGYKIAKIILLPIIK